MADKKTEKGISPALLGVGAVGLILIVVGLTMIPKKVQYINAKFNFDHFGPAEDIKLRVRFGAYSLGMFVANSDLVKVESFRVDDHPTLTPVEFNVKVAVPAKENLGFRLPFTYAAEAMIQDADGKLIGDNKLITSNVFTHTDEFEVIML